MTARKIARLCTPPALCLSLALIGCGGGGTGNTSGGGNTGGSGGTTPTTSTANQWTWEGGSSTTGASGVYGTLGTPSTSNVPGARTSFVSWTDSSGNFWLFGGNAPSTQTNISDVVLNDLWEYSPSAKAWTWVSGSSSVTGGVMGESGVYGTTGVASTSNTPGGRDGAVGWTDTSGNLWLFGGDGVDSTGNSGNLNDLWEFNPSAKTWTWVGGSKTANATGAYGTLGTPAVSNVPGARSFAVGWADKNGSLWLFGGIGGTTSTDLNDLWQYSISAKTWTWVSGSNTGNQAGIYGTQGTPSVSNVPGGRGDSATWIDTSGRLWLFGGAGLDSTGADRLLNDLWAYNISLKTWTWVSGSNTAMAAGAYGTLGIGSASNTPGARNGAIRWIDGSGNLWLFGGDGLDSTGAGGSTGTSLNDLWEFSPSTNFWTWISGSNLENAAGNYGTLGTASSSNVPRSRYSASGWIDTGGNMWMFGGQSGNGDLNDLWKFQP